MKTFLYILALGVLLTWAMSCKQHSKPLTIQENKPNGTLFDALSDSMNKNMWKSVDWAARNNRDSAIFYEGKTRAYLEMEGKEAYK